LPKNHGGGGWIRTSEAFASDLQSDPFGRSGTPPNCGAYTEADCNACQVILFEITYLRHNARTEALASNRTSLKRRAL
jgi:hypothetical protein